MWVVRLLAVIALAAPCLCRHHSSPLQDFLQNRFTTDAPPQIGTGSTRAPEGAEAEDGADSEGDSAFYYGEDYQASSEYDDEDEEDEDDGGQDYDEEKAQGDHDGGWGGQMSSHSEYKWRTMGSRPAVDALRGSRAKLSGFRNSASSVQLAVENALRVSREHECRWPVARLVRVQDVFPHPGKRYIPHCAALHQCADDAGCCHSDTLACVPAKTQPVDLYFYSTTVGAGAVVEKLTFYNHTECRCEDRWDAQMPKDMAVGVRLQPTFSSHSVSPLTCRCPMHFVVRRLSGGSVCLCECFGQHAMCLRQRRGKDYFSQADKHCIQSGVCTLPGCEFGQYLRKAGRCPRRRERLGAWISTHHRLHRHKD